MENKYACVLYHRDDIRLLISGRDSTIYKIPRYGNFLRQLTVHLRIRTLLKI